MFNSSLFHFLFFIFYFLFFIFHFLFFIFYFSFFIFYFLLFIFYFEFIRVLYVNFLLHRIYFGALGLCYNLRFLQLILILLDMRNYVLKDIFIIKTFLILIQHEMN